MQALEAVLREEKTRLGAQASLTLNRVGLSAAEPLPLAKLAVEDVCHRAMAVARKECERLAGLQRAAKAGRAAKALGYDRGRHFNGGASGGGSGGGTGWPPAVQTAPGSGIDRTGHGKRPRPGGGLLASLTSSSGSRAVGAMAARFVEQRRHTEAKREKVSAAGNGKRRCHFVPRTTPFCCCSRRFLFFKHTHTHTSAVFPFCPYPRISGGVRRHVV